MDIFLHLFPFTPMNIYTILRWKRPNGNVTFTHLRPQSGRFEWEKV